ncbi:MAG: TIGR00266 family protein [Thermoplasmata archaeon]|nr:MAG: TIGR00266 family protein [Thermoplasmata archaeon]
MSACPKCGSQMRFVEQYGQWYCNSCGQYQKLQGAQQPQAPNQPQPSTGNPGQRIMGGDLEYETVHSPSFTALIFYLKQGQSVVAEKGAMMYMHRTVEIKTAGRKGGLLKGIMTSALGGESFFVNTFTASTGPGELALVGPTMGDIRVIDVSRQGMIIQSGAYLASSPQTNLDTKWQGLKGFLSEKDFVMLHASGQGNVWTSSFGGIIEMNLRQGEVLSVDTGHLVAFPDNMQFSVRRVGGWKSTILSGEGLVSDLVGPGKILMQTRHLPAFVQALLPYLPQQR